MDIDNGLVLPLPVPFEPFIGLHTSAPSELKTVDAVPSVETLDVEVALGGAAEGVFDAVDAVPSVETLLVEVALGDAAEGVVASSVFVPAAERLDSLSSAVGLDPFRSLSVDALLTSFSSMPTEKLDWLVGALQALRHEFEPETMQRALAPLVNVEGVLLAALYARLSAPSLRHCDDVNIGSGHICGPDDLLDFFYHCCDYQDVRELEDWLRQLRVCRASELAVDGDPIGPVGDRVFEAELDARE
jgi:hypothetical protein